jgi:hypothetical protein
MSERPAPAEPGASLVMFSDNLHTMNTPLSNVSTLYRCLWIDWISISDLPKPALAFQNRTDLPFVAQASHQDASMAV